MHNVVRFWKSFGLPISFFAQRDLRTNKHFTLKENPLKGSDLDDFVTCYSRKNRHERKPTRSEQNPQGRWHAYDYETLSKRDKLNLDIFWLKDDSLEDSATFPILTSSLPRSSKTSKPPSPSSPKLLLI